MCSLCPNSCLNNLVGEFIHSCEIWGSLCGGYKECCLAFGCCESFRLYVVLHVVAACGVVQILPPLEKNVIEFLLTTWHHIQRQYLLCAQYPLLQCGRVGQKDSILLVLVSNSLAHLLQYAYQKWTQHGLCLYKDFSFKMVV